MFHRKMLLSPSSSSSALSRCWRQTTRTFPIQKSLLLPAAATAAVTSCETLTHNKRFFSQQSSRRRRHRRRHKTANSIDNNNNNNNNNNEPKKILFQSLGCPRNFVDTEVMLGMSVQAGLEMTQDVEEADYVVINTCGFLESARAESRSAIEEMIDAKKKTNGSKLLVTGCMVNLHKQEILEEFPGVDAILGSGAISKVMSTIEKLEQQESDDGDNNKNNTSGDNDNDNKKKKKQIVESAHRRSFLEQGDTPRFLATPPHYAYLKIAEGCRKRCSFCIIPSIKGKLQSKPVDQLVEEFSALTEHAGASEVILIAQDLGDYGKDMSKSNKESQLEHLLRELLQSNDDPDLWLRLLYLYPDEITPGLLDIMESDPRICRYLDMPIQHSHDAMLKLMRRKTNLAQIEDTIETLRRRLPGIHIRTSLMVGFPGETEEQFEHLLRFVQKHKLENVGVFKYSDEKLAYSSRLLNHVPEDIKEERYNRLMEAQLEIVRERNQQMVDDKKQLEVVVEGLNDDGAIVGRYYGQCPDIDGQVILEGNSRVFPGERYMVELTGFDEYDLIAKVL